MDARPSHADAKPSASYRDKSGIWNLWASGARRLAGHSADNSTTALS